MRWHYPKEFKALTNEQKDELTASQKTNEGGKIIGRSKEASDKLNKKRKASGMGGNGRDNKTIGQGAWTKKLKRVVQTQNGFKTIMSILASEEGKNQEWARVLASATASAPTPTPAPTPTAGAVTAATPSVPKSISFPATSLKLSAILKK